MSAVRDPHGATPLRQAGAPLERARLAMILVHGRGGRPEDMLGLAEHLALPDIAFLAPAAANGSWWPQSFLAPLAANEPGLSSGLSRLGSIVDEILAPADFSPERIALVGFSQGACLALEFAARAGLPFPAVFGLSGGLLGSSESGEPPAEALYGYSPKRFDYQGALAGSSVYLSCHERDPHIPLRRVRESEQTFLGLGASVRVEIAAGAGHGVLASDVSALRAALNR